MSTDWAQQRTEAAREHERRLEQRRRAQSERARALLRTFVAAARAADLPTEPLVVKGYGNRGSARTPLRGWYLRVDRTSAVTPDGDFYVLTAPLTTWERLRGTTPAPSDPPLVLGAGGKDGDSIDLTDALTRLLPGWDAATP